MNVTAALSLAMLPYVLIFLFMDVFDTLGTLIGVSEEAGFIQDNQLPRMKQALVSDALGTAAGAAFGTSTVTSFIESAAGVEQGGRTGLTAAVVAVLFLLALFFSPIIAMVGSYPPITAPALVVVGSMMIRNVTKIDWSNYAESMPAFLILAGIPLTYSIGDGLALGFISYPIIKLLAGQGRDVKWLMYVMAVVLVIRPYGLLGKAETHERGAAAIAGPLLRPASKRLRLFGMVLLVAIGLLPLFVGSFQLVLFSEIAIFSLAAMSLYFMMGPGGMVSFGHAAFFGGGAYAAALMVHYVQTPMELALMLAPLLVGLLALIIGWFCVRLSGVYLAMLTLAFAQICWSIVFQWGEFTGGDDGILSIWPSAWADDKVIFYYLTLVLCIGGILVLRYFIFTPFGYTMRACRDSALRVDSIGINLRRHQWLAFIVAGAFAGLAGGIYVFSKGSVFPDEMSIPRSFDFLYMVLLGGVETLSGPIVGSAAFTWLLDKISRIDFWQLILGAIFILLVVVFPQGIAGSIHNRFGRFFDDRSDFKDAI